MLNRSARWILFAVMALAVLTVGCRNASENDAPAETNEPQGSLPLIEISPSGTRSLGVSPFKGSRFAPEIMGPGIGASDLDSDGLMDLVVLQPPSDDKDKNEGQVRVMWQSEDGSFGASTELRLKGWPQAISFGDVNGDGLFDLGIVTWGLDLIFMNQGDRTFADPITLGDQGWTASAGFCDVDGDGDHDWITIGYLDYDPGVECLGPSGQADYCAPDSFPGMPDVLWRNQEGILIKDDSFGFEDPKRVLREAKGLGLACTDLTGDGLPDIYIANDRQPNHLWVNKNEGFVEEGALRGVAVNRMGRTEASMGVELWDQGRDGTLDIFITHLGGETNTFYRPERALWTDVTPTVGLNGDDFPYTGFGCVSFDANLDGLPDLAVANGRVRRGTPSKESKLSEFWSQYAEPDRLYLTAADGSLSFAGNLGKVHVSRGMISADLDQDLDEDLVVAYADGSIAIFRNQSRPPQNSKIWVIEVLDQGRRALGATVGWDIEGHSYRFPVTTIRSYQSAGPALIHWLQDGSRPSKVWVQWTDGTREEFEWREQDSHKLVLRRGEGILEPVP